ncbi:hypothetical protein [Streptomyces reniochalinae]|uniref:Tat pathway signal sequence domain protein n=1 Tax=Streptomyces reniochalinae TaxID=2250578 RepID=A0A367ECF9_9ACTN|nr:hypothetical protein [Streptomyces reniochalinae]RCG15469.1 hypothetical protein DQ392_25290 [Streptomyces reniochalinae]
MRKFTRRAAVAAVAAVAALGFSAASAAATSAGTWTVTPGGAFSANASQPTLSVPNAQLVCSSSDAGGDLKTGSGNAGAGLGTIDSLTFTGCSLAGISFDVTVSSPLSINAESVDAGNPDRVTGSISGITASISDADGLCSASFAGPDGGDATVTGYFDNATHQLVINGGNLQATDADCLGLINAGDSATFNAAYDTDPAQTITAD